MGWVLVGGLLAEALRRVGRTEKGGAGRGGEVRAGKIVGCGASGRVAQLFRFIFFSKNVHQKDFKGFLNRNRKLV